jgi:hypothetical protein
LCWSSVTAAPWGPAFLACSLKKLDTYNNNRNMQKVSRDINNYFATKYSLQCTYMNYRDSFTALYIFLSK